MRAAFFRVLTMVSLAALPLAGLAAEGAADLFAGLDSDKSTTGATTDTAKGDDALGDGPELTLFGDHSAEFRIPVPTSQDYNNFDGSMKVPEFDNEIGLEFTSGPIKLVSQWKIGISPDTAGSTQQLGDWSKLAKLSPLENAIYWSPEHFWFGFGYQYFSWGTADKRNPTDNINPRDYSAGLNADVIPVLAAAVKWYPSDAVTIEGVYVPLVQPDIFPVDTKDKLTAKGFSNTSYNAVGNYPSSFVAGGRVAFRFPVIDFSFSYLYDFDHFFTPVISTTLGTISGLGAAYVVNGISLERKRIHRVGADMKMAIDTVGLWLEAAYSITEDPLSNNSAIRNPNLDWTLGFDFSYGPGSSFYINVQYTGSFVVNYDKNQGSDYSFTGTKFNPVNKTDPSYMQEFYNRQLVQSLGSQNQGLQQGISINAKWPIADNVVTPQLTAAYVLPFLYDTTNEIRYGSLILKPELDLMPFDAFHIKLGADLVYSWKGSVGGATTLNYDTDSLGSYISGNRVYLAVEYSWNHIFK